jgi:hypothetical protein
MRRHIDGWRPSPGLLVGVLALVAAVAGTAVAGPGATTSKLTKKKVVQIADQEINKLAPGLSVAHAESANTATHADSATSADKAASADSALSAQSALAADTADSVGGVSIEPVRMSVPENTAGPTVVSVDGSLVDINLCSSAGQIGLRIHRDSMSPPLTAEWITSASGATVNHLSPGTTVSNNFAAIGLSATIRQSSGRVTRVFIDGFYEQNGFGGTDDCFVQGTIERFG